MAEFVSLHKSLKKEVKLHKARQILDEQLKVIPNVQEYRMSNQITLLVCNIIENLFTNNSKKYKVDKKKLVLEILVPVFGLTEQEISVVEKQIEYLWEQGEINQIPSYKLFGLYLYSWVKKKTL